MKNSLYNSLISLNEEYSLLYNAMSDNFLILNKSNLIKWNEYQNERAVLQVESDFYKQLINTGFLVDECKDMDKPH